MLNLTHILLIFIVLGGPLFVDFTHYPYPQNNISMNQTNFGSPQTLVPTNKNDSTVYTCISVVLLLEHI